MNAELTNSHFYSLETVSGGKKTFNTTPRAKFLNQECTQKTILHDKRSSLCIDISFRDIKKWISLPNQLRFQNLKKDCQLKTILRTFSNSEFIVRLKTIQNAKIKTRK